MEGRKIFTHGVCFAGETMTAEADGIFISIDPSKIEGLLAMREQWEARQ